MTPYSMFDSAPVSRSPLSSFLRLLWSARRGRFLAALLPSLFSLVLMSMTQAQTVNPLGDSSRAVYAGGVLFRADAHVAGARLR